MKILKQSTYNDLILMQELVMSQNAEMKKVCQCRECKYNGKWYEYAITDKCYNALSDNYNERMSQYGSCKQCEGR